MMDWQKEQLKVATGVTDGTYQGSDAAKAVHMLDLYTALGVKFGEDPFAAIARMREWVDLTDEELVALRERVQEYTPMDSIKYGEAIQRATAQALKDKNS